MPAFSKASVYVSPIREIDSPIPALLKRRDRVVSKMKLIIKKKKMINLPIAAIIKHCNRASYTSIFGNRRNRPPIAVIIKAAVLSYSNRISYTSGFKRSWYRLLYYSGFKKR